MYLWFSLQRYSYAKNQFLVLTLCVKAEGKTLDNNLWIKFCYILLDSTSLMQIIRGKSKKDEDEQEMNNKVTIKKDETVSMLMKARKIHWFFVECWSWKKQKISYFHDGFNFDFGFVTFLLLNIFTFNWLLLRDSVMSKDLCSFIMQIRLSEKEMVKIESFKFEQVFTLIVDHLQWTSLFRDDHIKVQ